MQRSYMYYGLFVSVGVECGFLHSQERSEIRGILEVNAAENIYCDQIGLLRSCRYV
jgi:hypothetical protein